jgi:hypothetical protein
LISIDIFSYDLGRGVGDIFRSRKLIEQRGFKLNFYNDKNNFPADNLCVVSTLFIIKNDLWHLLPSIKHLVIFDKTDPATCRFPVTLKLPNVIRYIKGSLLSPAHLQNQSEVRYHLRKIVDKEILDSQIAQLKTSRPQLEEEDLEKLVAGPGLGTRPIFHSLNIDPLNERSIDVIFAGSTYSRRSKHIANHRDSLCDLLESSSGNNIVRRELDFTQAEYKQHMLNAKIAMCPYGEGEHSYRQFEAMYCGAIPILADQSFVTSVYDLKPGVNYLNCNANWSNLTNSIDEVLNNLAEFSEMQQRNYELMQKWNLPATIADWFEKVFKEIITDIR